MMTDLAVDILVVDDNPDELIVMRSILEEHGFYVRTAINGKLALSSVNEKAPDLILIDITMPGMDGIQVCERLKSNVNSNIRNIPLIFVSARAEGSDKAKAFAAGGVDFITKPYQQEEILARIETHLKLQQMQIELTRKNDQLRKEIRERTLAEKSFRESEERFRAIFEQAAVGVAQIATKTSEFVQINQRYCDIVGYTIDEMKQITFKEISHPDDLKVDLAHMQRLMDGEIREFSMEKRYFHKNGTVVWVNLTASAMWQAGEAPDFHIAVVEDISEQKRAEKALYDSENRFRHLIEQSPYSTALFSPDGYLLYGNPASTKFFYMDDQQLAELIQTYNVLEDPQLIAQGQMPFIEKGFAGQYSEIPPVRHDLGQLNPELEGRFRWVQSFIYPVKDNNGVVKEVVLIHEDITQRVLAEEALQESEARLQAFFDSSPVGNAIFDTEFRYIMVNDVMQKGNGPSKAEHLGSTIRDILPKGASILEPIFEKILATGEPVLNAELSSEIPGNPGVLSHFIASYFPIFGIDGKPIAIGASVLNVTDRVQTEAELHQSEVRYRAVVETASDGIITIDEHGNIVSWNRGAEEIFGYTGEEINGRSVTTIMPEGFHAAHQNSLAHVAATGKLEMAGKTVEHIGCRKDGREFPLELSLAQWEENGTAFFTSIVRDISERVQIEKTLRESEQKLSFLIDNIADAVWQMDLRLNFTYVSPSVYPLMGYTPEEWVGTNLSQYATGTEFFKMARQALNAIKNYKEIKHLIFEANLLKKNGESFPVEIITKLIFNEHGLPIGLQGTTRDITERKLAEEALRQSESRLSVVFNNTSDLQLLWAVEFDGSIRVLSVNNPYIAAAKSFGINVSEADIVGKTFSEMAALLGIDQDTHHFLVKKYQQAIESGEVNRYTENIDIGTGTYHAEITLIPVADQSGNCQFVLYNSHNVTELKETADALQTLNAELDERVHERTEDLSKMVQLMAGREVRMAELKRVIKTLREQLEDAGMQPAANDPLLDS